MKRDDIQETKDEFSVRKSIKDKNDYLNEAYNGLENNNYNIMVVQGSPGMGKTYRTAKKFPSAIFIAGHLTPLQLYKTLHDNADKTIVIDDTSFKGVTFMNILKSASWGDRRVSWHSSDNVLETYNIEREFTFSGKIILLTNEKIEPSSPLANRGLVIDWDFSFDEKKIILNDLCKPEVSKVITSISQDMRLNSTEDLNNSSSIKALKDEQNLSLVSKSHDIKCAHICDHRILEYMTTRCINHDQYNIRSLKLLTNVTQSGGNWKLIATHMFSSNEELQNVQNILSKHKTIKRACSEWMATTGKSRATFFRKYKQLQ